MAVEQLLVRLLGDGSSYRNMLTNATAQTRMFTKSIDKARAGLTNVANGLTSMGKTLTTAVTVPMIGVGTASVAAFAKFDKAMVESTSIMKVTAEQTERMRDLAISLSARSTKGPADLARAYFFLASAGLDAEQSMKALPQVAKFATAGAFDMATATDLLTDAQSALGLTVKDATKNLEGMAKVSDVLVKANTLANATVQQFSEALTNTAGATLKNFNKPIEEGVAVLAAYADQGVKAQVAGTNLTRVTLLLQKSALKQAAAHARLGFEVFDAAGKMNNYANIMEQLENITEGMTDEQKAATLATLGFEARIQNAILPLIGASKKIKEYEAELRKAGGTTDTVANKQMSAFSNQLTVLKNRATGLAIAIGEELAPYVLQLANLVGNLHQDFEKTDDATKALIASSIALAGALGPILLSGGLLLRVMAPLIGAMSGVGGAIATAVVSFVSLLNPVVAIIAAVAALVIGLRLMIGSWEDTGTVIKNIADLAVDVWITATQTLQRLIQLALIKIGMLVYDLWNAIWTVDYVAAVKKGIEMSKRLFLNFTGWLGGKFARLFGMETFQKESVRMAVATNRLAKGESFSAVAFRALQQGMGDFKQLREGKEVIPQRGREAIQANLASIRGEASKKMEETAKNTKEMVRLLKEAAQKAQSGATISLKDLGLE